MTRRIGTTTITTALLFLLHPTPGIGQYRIEFMNHSGRAVHILVLDERGYTDIYDINSKRTRLEAQVAADGRVLLGATLLNNRTYYLHVTPVDGLTPTKVITVRTGPCCPSVTRTITYAVDSGDLPTLVAGTPSDQGGGAREVANHPYLGAWACQGSGTMRIQTTSGSLEGVGGAGLGSAGTEGRDDSRLQVGHRRRGDDERRIWRWDERYLYVQALVRWTSGRLDLGS